MVENKATIPKIVLPATAPPSVEFLICLGLVDVLNIL